MQTIEVLVPMKWEYRVEDVEQKMVANQLSISGDKGWELVTAYVQGHDGKGEPIVTLIYKRPIE